MNNHDYILAQGAYGLRLNSNMDEDFLIQYSNTVVYRKLMQSIAVGSTQIHIRTPEFLNINLLLPPLEEQKQIAQILTTADEKIELLKTKKEKYETLKKGLLQKLLSGEIRVGCCP